MTKKDIELDIEGKGNIKIPWKVILLIAGIAATALGVQEDAFQSILDIVND
tara:strand:+ start:134 stop:286 length:153 start_codon:yes stop_codon:yes gene_type:complete